MYLLKHFPDKRLKIQWKKKWRKNSALLFFYIIFKIYLQSHLSDYVTNIHYGKIHVSQLSLIHLIRDNRRFVTGIWIHSCKKLLAYEYNHVQNLHSSWLSLWLEIKILTMFSFLHENKKKNKKKKEEISILFTPPLEQFYWADSKGNTEYTRLQIREVSRFFFLLFLFVC